MAQARRGGEPHLGEWRARAVLLEEMALAAMVEELKAAMPQRPSVAILGGTQLHNDLSRPFIEQLGRTFGERLRGKVNFITGGNLGVQGLFTKSLGPKEDFESLVYHFLPKGTELPSGDDSSFPCPFGTELAAGSNWAERNSLIAQIANVVIVIEGGPGAAGEVTEAFKRTATYLLSLEEASKSLAQANCLAEDGGPLILCVRWTGGAAGGMSFGEGVEQVQVPPEAFLPHSIATEDEWKSLQDKRECERAPSAIVGMVAKFLGVETTEPNRAAKTERTEYEEDEDPAPEAARDAKKQRTK